MQLFLGGHQVKFKDQGCVVLEGINWR